MSEQIVGTYHERKEFDEALRVFQKGRRWDTYHNHAEPVTLLTGKKICKTSAFSITGRAPVQPESYSLLQNFVIISSVELKGGYHLCFSQVHRVYRRHFIETEQKAIDGKVCKFVYKPDWILQSGCFPLAFALAEVVVDAPSDAIINLQWDEYLLKLPRTPIHRAPYDPSNQVYGELSERFFSSDEKEVRLVNHVKTPAYITEIVLAFEEQPTIVKILVSQDIVYTVDTTRDLYVVSNLPESRPVQSNFPFAYAVKLPVTLDEKYAVDPIVVHDVKKIYVRLREFNFLCQGQLRFS